ncbi:MAG: hypothetical protein AAF206_01445 [Bacteroidota bacterium]
MARFTLHLFLSSLITALFGSSLSSYFPAIEPLTGAWYMLLMAGTGWVVMMAGSFFLTKDWQLYWKTLGKIMLVGVSLLLPYILLHNTFTHIPVWVPIVSVCISSLSMLYIHHISMNLLRFSQRHTTAWFLSLQSTAAFWIILLMFYV